MSVRPKAGGSHLQLCDELYRAWLSESVDGLSHSCEGFVTVAATGPRLV